MGKLEVCFINKISERTQPIQRSVDVKGSHIPGEVFIQLAQCSELTPGNLHKPGLPNVRKIYLLTHDVTQN
ncbi:Unknown protein sequence [Pseudomonas savastanoi pv. glycinea]|uniref:Uncharacterized protein n=1 Tax=Pseudomonas savastanoi pv. glycinea TaxID=318 RepID=A0ABR5L981_PSESG|nr:Unknown protein sequence [Pseudomonas savastanoi pv. glycinea]KPC41970.1 Unknown protein sequence [Pseudomonas savastanoi pv. glycinea]RMU02137.1 hypothetical protein ALP35_104030 [Pseudomonas savastanoi pv. glycinea]